MSEDKKCKDCVYSEPLNYKNNYICHFFNVYSEEEDAKKCKQFMKKVKI